MESHESNEALGIDLGGGIINTEGRSFRENLKIYGPAIPLMEGALESIGELVTKRFGKETYVVSKCSEESERKILEVLNFHDFYFETGISKDNIYFCRDFWDKAPICTSLGITHFVDDRLGNLGYLHEEGIQNLFLFNPREIEVAENRRHLPRVQRVESWYDVVGRLL